MNTLLTLALACTLGTAPNTDEKTTSPEKSTYLVTDKFAIWTTEAGKLKVSMAHQNSKATIELRNGQGTLYRETLNLREGAHQTFDLSQVADGAYQVWVTIGDQ